MAQTFKPRQPYLFGGYNQVTARRANAHMLKVLGLVDKVEKALPQRIEKRAVRHCEQHGYKRISVLPREARKLVMGWAADDVRTVNSVLCGYAD